MNTVHQRLVKVEDRIHYNALICNACVQFMTVLNRLFKAKIDCLFLTKILAKMRDIISADPLAKKHRKAFEYPKSLIFIPFCLGWMSFWNTGASWSGSWKKKTGRKITFPS